MVEDIEKRRYFRINDTISLQYKIVDEKTTERYSHISQNVLNNCSLTAALDVMRQECRLLAPRLERRDPEFFEYLRLIDTKIDLIAQAVEPNEIAFCQQDHREVTISATGVAFTNEQAIDEGAFLELRMLLTSAMSVVVAYGRVVQCKPNPENNVAYPVIICAEFINMTEEDRELVVRHVVKKQMQMLRDKNEGIN